MELRATLSLLASLLLITPPLSVASSAAVPASATSAAPMDHCVYRQPWDGVHPSFPSHVRSCQQPVPARWVAMDDWHCDIDGEVRRIDWWGNVISPQQLERPYYIAIYADDNCKPGALLYETCVQPKAKFVGFDCEQRRVYRFRTKVPGGFSVAAGERLWLQISADSEASVEPGAEVFRWSSRLPQRECFAAAMDDAGNLVCPLIEPCNQETVDLAFAVLVRAP